MAKTLKDIITPERAGRNIPGGEGKFLDTHKVDEKDYPVKQKTNKLPHTPTTSHKPDDKHGYTADKESEKVYTKTNKKGVSESSDDVEDLKNRIKKIASKQPFDVTEEDRKDIVDASQKLRSMKKEEIEQVDEALEKSDPASTWVKDFVHSDDPKFEGKSKKKRMQMALAAYYSKQKEN
jgi:hypothetical protein